VSLASPKAASRRSAGLLRRPGQARRRLRRGAALASVLTAVAAAVWASASAPLPRPRAEQWTRTYLAELALPLAEESQLASAVSSLVGSVGTMDRRTLVTDLVALDETARSTSSAVSSMVAGPARTSLDLGSLKRAVRLWALGARDLEIGSLASIGSGVTAPELAPGVVVPPEESSLLWASVSAATGSERATELLNSSFAYMSRGDEDYSAFAASVARLGHMRGIVPMGQVRWLPPGWSVGSLALFEQALVSAPGLTPRRSASVEVAAVSPAPIPPALPGGVATIVGTSKLDATVVIDNSGNVDLPGIEVELSFQPKGPAPGVAAGGVQPAASPVVKQATVDVAAGSRVTVSFGDIALPLGDVYDMTASVVPSGPSGLLVGPPLSETFALEA
jgi:hypothetical protein